MSSSFFGTGLAYPMRLDKTGARPLVISNDDLIKASIAQILNTDITERPFLTSNGIPFGTRIRRALFQPAEVVMDIAIYECRRALGQWEPRIIVDDVTSEEQPQASGGSAILVTVYFRYRSTNRSDNFVTPFRLVRAT